jgi:hypothetical protein
MYIFLVRALGNGLFDINDMIIAYDYYSIVPTFHSHYVMSLHHVGFYL